MVVAGTFVACNSTDKKAEDKPSVDQESEAAIEDMLAQEMGKSENWMTKKDSMIMQAYKEDKTTISINDLDKSDTTLSMQLKNLYRGLNGERLAVVYGLRKEGKMGTAILQFEGKELIKLPQTKQVNVTDMVFSDGSTTLETKGADITIKSGGKATSFKAVQ